MCFARPWSAAQSGYMASRHVCYRKQIKMAEQPGEEHAENLLE